MFVPLPNLDDRRWADLVQDGLSLIPAYSPAWTDENYSDPGITLAELFAWTTEASLYQINRISDSTRLLMLELVGVTPAYAQLAAGLFAFQLTTPGAKALLIPASTEILTTNQGLSPTVFETAADLWIQPASISAVITYDGSSLQDATLNLVNGKNIALLGQAPGAGSILYLGINGGIDNAHSLAIAFAIAGDKVGNAERQRLLAWAQAQGQSAALPPYHSAKTVWEAQTAQGVWTAISAQDDTRSLTLTGTVVLDVPAVPETTVGRLPYKALFLRCRLESGQWDAPPIATAIRCNSLSAVQKAALVDRWVLAQPANVLGTAPSPAATTPISVAFNDAGEITRLDFTASPSTPTFRFLQLDTPAAPARSTLALEALRIGKGNGAPNQWFQVPVGAVTADLRVFTSEAGVWKQWTLVSNFENSGPADLHCTLQMGSTYIIFGDGQNGRTPVPSSFVVVSGHSTEGAAGNVSASVACSLDDGIHNVALLGNPQALQPTLTITLPQDASDGVDPETLTGAEARAVATYGEVTRAITASDCEQLALTTPGTQLARAMAAVGQHPGFPCMNATGITTVVIVPDMPVPKPAPSSGLIAAVSAWLNSKRLVGSAIDVTGADFVTVQVIAAISSVKGQSKSAIQSSVVLALNNFLDALTGGPNGTGWPLGRAVYSSEILDVIATIPGVDHVDSLALNVPGCGSQCDSVCLKAHSLVAPGDHQIQVS